MTLKRGNFGIFKLFAVFHFVDIFSVEKSNISKKDKISLLFCLRDRTSKILVDSAFGSSMKLVEP